MYSLLFPWRSQLHVDYVRLNLPHSSRLPFTHNDLLWFQPDVSSPGKRNRVNNMRYGWRYFLIGSLANQFSDFFNLFYLLMTLSQLFPALVIGPVYTYLTPLAFVIVLSIFTEFLYASRLA